MIDSLAKAFPNLHDIESRVNNIKERIFLMKKAVPSKTQTKSEPAEEAPLSEMEILKAKLMRK